MRRLLFIFFISVFPGILYSQSEEGYLDLVKYEILLESLFERLYNVEAIESPRNVYEAIDTVFASALAIPGSINYAWERLNKIGKLKSEDGKVRVFSWYYLDPSGSFDYTCYMQIATKRGKSVINKHHAMTDKTVITNGYQFAYKCM